MKQPAPRATVRCWASNLEHPQSSHRSVASLLRVAASVTVVVPRADQAEALRAVLQQRGHYATGQLEPRALLQRHDSLLLLSRGAHELGRYCRLSPGSALHVALPRDLHQRAGLDGRQIGDVWLSAVECGDDAAARVKRAFDVLPGTLFFACSEDNAPVDAPPLEPCSAKLERKAIPGLRWPALGGGGDDTLDEEKQQRMEHVKAVLEWSGAVLAGATALTTRELSTNQLAPTFCAYRLGALRTEAGGGFLLRWSGMLSAATCLHVLDALRAVLVQDDCALFAVNGFAG